MHFTLDACHLSLFHIYLVDHGFFESCQLKVKPQIGQTRTT